ncbi:SapC family protein [Burkholderia sp. JSH-S8]|nr:SapC family protein [Burkholderia sp. JSH-S8]
MEIAPPFGYRNLKALNRSDHVRYSATDALPPFVKETAIVPLSIGEMVSAACHYPLVFVGDVKNNRAVLVAMLGLVAGENLFLTGKGWRAGAYLPAYVRRYPFCMAHITVNEQADPNLVVCVEKDYVMAEADEGSRRLFDDTNKATVEWQSIEAFLMEYEADLERTNAFCSRLVDLDLLEPLTVNITQPNKASCNVTGFLGINEGKLAKLADDTILEWYCNGWLARAYLHLFSLQRLQCLLQVREEQRVQHAASETIAEQSG